MNYPPRTHYIVARCGSYWMVYAQPPNGARQETVAQRDTFEEAKDFADMANSQAITDAKAEAERWAKAGAR